MPCTTILVGKNATYDGSTMMARNDDSASGKYTPKKFVAVAPEQQPRHYRSVISHCEVDLPDDPMRYTAVPDAVQKVGIWAASGVNEANVAMTATETITSNERVLGADPLVTLVPEKDGQPEIPGGLGEEDFVVLVLPYIRSAREGVQRLGALLEKYGTYEMNGIGFQDRDEIWWLETIGGHHWIARRVPDDVYVVMPNQLGIDAFDLNEAAEEQQNFMCSADLASFIQANHLDVSNDDQMESGQINPREVFGSHDDADHVYNTPRAWFMERYLNPNTYRWDGQHADFLPESDDIPWCLVPERLITVEDVKYVLSGHYQGTPFDPYGSYGDPSKRGMYRSIGINRNDFLALIQIRPDVAPEISAVEWLAFASNAFNAMMPFYANITKTPEYLASTTGEVSTGSFYWCSRLIAALSDASYAHCRNHVERYQKAAGAKGHEILNRYDHEAVSLAGAGEEKYVALCERANEETAAALQKMTADMLAKALYEVSNDMKNSFSRSDA